MLPCPPRLRSDLTFSRQQTATGTVSVVKDPVSGSFFRLRDVERFIAEQLDGTTPLDVVRRRTEEKFGASLPAETLDAFVKHLEKTGLLETGHSARKGRTGHHGRIRGSLLYLRFPLLDPDRLLTRLVRRVRFCFTPAFLVLSAALILAAVGITVAHGGELSQDLARLYQPSAIPLFVGLLVLIISAHEFAHGLTCKHFGGEVHEMGFMLIYFQPALYCNVSDAWLFPEKAKRLWVSFAGAYFELFLWGLATLTWRTTEVDTWINYLALMVMTISGVKSLLNFNPFIKLDGYYLLSDFLGIPNLRRKSFRYVGDGIKRLIGLAPAVAAEISPRERRVYLAYGVVATVFSLSLLGYVFMTAGGYLIEMRQPGALLVLTGLVGIRSRVRFRKLFGGSSDASEGDDGDDFVASRATGSSKPPEPTKKRPSRSRRRRRFWAALAAAALLLVIFGRMQLRVGGAFTVLPEENADVRAEVEGIIEEVYVDEGDSVAAGTVIARLSDRTVSVELRKTEAEVREARADHKRLRAGHTAEEIAVARAGVSRAQDRLRYAQSSVQRLASLFEVSGVTRQELEAAQELAATAENDLAEARGRLNVLLRGSRPEEIEATKARIDRLEAQQRYLEEQLRLLKIVSPVAGIVATPARQLQTLEGQLVGKGSLIAKVYDFRAVMAQIVISEKEIADVRAGQRVVVRARAYPDVGFEGTVTAIATASQGSTTASGETPIGGASPSGAGVPGKAFIVTTRIDNSSLLLKPGMSGHAKVLAGERRIIGLVTRRLARTFKVEFWSWW